MSTKWYNYFVNAKNSRLTNGHIPSNRLYDKILDHDGREAYCCYFDLDYSSLKMEYFTGEHEPDGTKIYDYLPQSEKPKTDFLKPEMTFTQYEGLAKPSLGMVSFDFDSDNVQESLNDVKAFVKWLAVDDIAVFFSGSKGFHVMVPWTYFPLEASSYLPNQLKDAAKILNETYPTLDTSIYNYNRKFRVPFSKHDKSGLYKSIISIDQFDLNHLDDFKDLIVKPDFLKDIMPNVPREPLEVLVELFDKSKRVSYEIEKAKAGTKEKPSPFEKFDGKLCIKKLLDSRCDDVGRNNACIRIVNDFFRTGKMRVDCEQVVHAWAKKVGLSLSEVNPIINNIYTRSANYNFGCQDEIKASYCTAKCDLWRKLAPDKRPEVPDAPASESLKIKTDYDGVKWLMENIFGSFWDAERNGFTLGSIVKQGAKDLFYYKDNHWQHIDEPKVHVLQVKLNASNGNKLPDKKLESIFRMLIKYVPHVPVDVNMFAPKSSMANFEDGTLHLITNDEGYNLDFKDHNKLDFCTTKFKASYKSFVDSPDVKNEMFEDWLLDCLEGDQERFNLVQEMFAATILPNFAQFFFILGASTTGKSTMMKILKRMHDGADYICGVSPDKFHGFHMQSMVGNLINLVMDIKTSAAIDDDVVKQVDDQEPVRIERKKLDDIYAPLPPIHILGANKMPPTKEGYSGAMNRRAKVINFDVIYTGKRNKNIANKIYNENPQGILNFALRGLMRLVLDNQGEYTSSSRSQENVNKWTRKSDIISQFVENIANEGINDKGDRVHIIINESLSISKTQIWYYFKVWQSDALEKVNILGKMTFYEAMADHGYIVKRTSKGECYMGVGLESDMNGDASV